MFDIRDLFQWERFITPSIIRVFFWLAFFVAWWPASLGSDRRAAAAIQSARGVSGVLVSVSGACLAVLTARLLAELC